MKNLYLTMLCIVCFAQTAYPILGTRRRQAMASSQASQQKQMAAYQAGLAQGTGGNMNDLSEAMGDDVQVQSIENKPTMQKVESISSYPLYQKTQQAIRNAMDFIKDTAEYVYNKISYALSSKNID